MPKLSPPLPLVLPPRDAAEPTGRWLCAALRDAILGGRLPPGTRLPATRDLARQYGLSRGTIVAAFEQLRAEGYVRGRVGAGTYVNETLPDDLLHVAGGASGAGAVREPRVTPRSAPRPPRAPERRLSAYGRRVVPIPSSLPSTRAFRANQPALDLFPTTLWAQVAGRCMRRASTQDLLGCGPMGYPPLRAAVAQYLTTSRGVRCEAEQVAIVAGAQEALDIIARLVLDPGDRVCLEEPGYDGARRVFEAAGATVVPVPVDDEGMTIPDARLAGVRLAYVTPAHQFPLGIAMTLPRRLALLEWARAAGALVVEDDYDSEYRFAGRPIPALQGLDRHGLVCFVGTFSKVLVPALRLGYLVVPPDLVDAVAAAKSVTSRHAPLLEQAALAEFITEGHFGRHVRRMREVYAERLGVLLEAARARLGGLLEISDVEAGMQTVGWLGDGVDAAAVARAAAAREVEVIPLSRYASGPLRRGGLQLGFAAVDVPELQRGVRELGAVLEGGRRSVDGGR